MNIKIKFFLFFSLVIVLMQAPRISASDDEEAPDDETLAAPGQPKMERVLLAPWLHDHDAKFLNITAENGTKRSVKPDEWLKYGDAISLKKENSIFVQLNEGAQWVGGGVFSTKIKVDKDVQSPTYEIVLTHGWMKVWTHPTIYTGTVVINTPKVNLIARDAVFWVSLANAKTELYVVSGSVSCGTKECRADHFYQWVNDKAKVQLNPEEWTDETFEARIAKLYPGLVKMADKANQIWLDEDSYEKYSQLRKQNWKKTQEEKKKVKPRR